jgi:hypothetical protein
LRNTIKNPIVQILPFLPFAEIKAQNKDHRYFDFGSTKMVFNPAHITSVPKEKYENIFTVSKKDMQTIDSTVSDFLDTKRHMATG